MSRLTELLARAQAKDPDLGRELAEEVRKVVDRRSFGLTFEHHVPETVQLPGRRVRRGDKVRFVDKADEETWRVVQVRRDGAKRIATLVDPGDPKGSDPITAPADELVVVADFRDPIYPGLRSTGRLEEGGDKPYSIVINAENFHALEAMVFAYESRVDLIYIDPPYNTEATTWKYNNKYVDENDEYRHSKWLAFMERRLRLAKKLLNPSRSVLLVTIDDNEIHRLGLLLEKVFRGVKRQMVSITNSPRGRSKATELSQVDEYMFVLYFGDARMTVPPGSGQDGEVRWRYLRRNDIESARGTTKGGPAQFYPIYVDDETQRIVKIGEPLAHDQPLEDAEVIEGTTAVFPIRDDGQHMNWGLTGPSLQKALEDGFVRVSKASSTYQPYTFAYLTRPNVQKIERGELTIAGERPDGSKIVVVPGGKTSRPSTVWRDSRYDAGAYGTALLGDLIPGRKFPFPKSLYAVEDALRLFVGENPDALILDFFAGSGTTAHAVARLNRHDEGRRRSVSVTNNEVSPAEAKALAAKGHKPGDPEWEALGICEYITKPRLTAAVTGKRHDGEPVAGDYKFNDEYPMASGFQENVEFFEVTYEDPDRVRLDYEFAAIAPLLWMRAGSVGKRIDERSNTFAIADTYGVLFDVDHAEPFVAAVSGAGSVRLAFIVTDNDSQYQTVAEALPHDVAPVRLYESYLRTVEINTGKE